MAIERFLLRLPFQPLQTVTGLDQPLLVHVGNIVVHLKQSAPPYLALEAEPFETQEAAKAFMPRLWGALALMSIQARVGIVVQDEFESVLYAADPYKAAENLERFANVPNTGPVDGSVAVDRPAVIPLDKNIRFSILYPPSVEGTIARQSLEPSLLEALRSPEASLLYTDERLRTAVELLSDSHRENSMRSRFLTLVTALEVLAEPVKKHAIAQRLLDNFDMEVGKALASYLANSDEARTLTALRQDLSRSRQASIGAGIRALVQKTFAHLPPDERASLSKQASWVYEKRSRLVHDGTIDPTDLRNAFRQAHELVTKIVLASQI